MNNPAKVFKVERGCQKRLLDDYERLARENVFLAKRGTVQM